MKTKLLAAGALLLAMAANAQITTIYANDFSATAGLSIIDADGDSNNWGLYNSSATTTSWGLTGGFAGSESWDQVGLNPDNYLFTTNAIDIPAGFGTTTLSLNAGVSNPGFAAEHLGVWVVPAVNNTAALIAAYCETNPALIELTMDDTYAQTVTLLSEDLDASLNGTAVRLVFRHFDTFDQELLYIDDILLSQETLATKNFGLSQFSVFPNPSKNVINVEGKQNQSITAINVTDLNGRTVLTQNFGKVNAAQINIAALASGMYNMTVTSEEGTAVQKIVKN